MTSANIESRQSPNLPWLLNGLRQGNFVTRDRMRVVAVAIIALTIIVLGHLAVTSSNWVDFKGRPLGTDFSSFYSSGKAALGGEPTVPYDHGALHKKEKEIFGENTPFYAWQYPPFFLAMVTPLALLPYPVALALWQGGTLILFLLMLRAIAMQRPEVASDRLWLLLALGFPAVYVNLGHGQNGFLSAALLGAALLQLDRRPLLAGVFFGLLAYKPQLGVMIPLVLIATGRWRTFFSAAATVTLLVLVTFAVFGADVWRTFLDSMSFTRQVLLEQGNPGWEKIQSVFAGVRLLGGSTELAYGAQIAASLAVAVSLIWIWRSNARFAWKAAALVLGLMLGGPFSLDYDMTILAVAIAFLAVDGLQHGFAPYEKTLLAALWLVPLLARTVAALAHIPLGVITMGAVFVFVVVTTTRPALALKSA